LEGGLEVHAHMQPSGMRPREAPSRRSSSPVRPDYVACYGHKDDHKRAMDSCPVTVETPLVNGGVLWSRGDPVGVARLRGSGALSPACDQRQWSHWRGQLPAIPTFATLADVRATSDLLG
jgi:hypothetical protein